MIGFKPAPPTLVRKHVDGPYVLANGQMRWLTIGERIALLFGRLPREFRLNRSRRAV